MQLDKELGCVYKNREQFTVNYDSNCYLLQGLTY
jgi:hypothetical protein